MNRAEIERRDATIRAYLSGKDWDENDEFKLKRRLVLSSSTLLPSLPFVVDDEWEVKAGHTNEGRGDLVFTDGEGRFAVVEVKFIDLGRSGSTARVKRTHSRGKVVDQARTYAQRLRARLGEGVAVEAWVFTNEAPVPRRVDGLGSAEAAC